MNWRNWIGICVLVWLSACGNTEKKESKGRPIAKVFDHYLYESDLKGILPNRRISSEDSANLVNRYVNAWIRKELMLQQAEKEMGKMSKTEKEEIENRVREYRFGLMTYAFERNFLKNQLDTVITKEQIEAYYRENLANFELKHNIIQGLFVKLKKETPRLDDVRQWVRKGEELDIEDLKVFCVDFADKFHLDTGWVDMEQVIGGTPFATILRNQAYAIRTNTFLEMSDSSHLYFLKIKDFKIGNDISPLSFVEQNIKEIILNKRKVTLKQELERKIYEDATENQYYEIFRN